MAQTKKMDESAFAMLIKEFNAVGELIRARQDEKQAIIDEFDSEGKRFFLGKISEKTLASSVRKTNNEFQKLDNEISDAMEKAQDIANQAKRFVGKQSPKTFKATLSGVSSGGKKRKKAVRRRPKKTKAKRKTVKRKSVKKKPAKKKSVRKKK